MSDAMRRMEEKQGYRPALSCIELLPTCLLPIAEPGGAEPEHCVRAGGLLAAWSGRPGLGRGRGLGTHLLKKSKHPSQPDDMKMQKKHQQEQCMTEEQEIKIHNRATHPSLLA
ncbi:hypothetical protein NDU88_009345 [Pleurodeles waltl]|uniref:Uncharacterized protein n=1 Tax=Pleurodeles waltl TaxID=8319 RepID=A0AAV7QSD6_PLEWA|nr:hypothetical protein NDU88_009345 [Pleurodeles waltl]